MKTTTITCDAPECGKDLTEVCEGTPRYRIAVCAEEIHNTSNVRFAIVTHPPIKRAYHFCNWSCLIQWLADRNLPKKSEHEQ